MTPETQQFTRGSAGVSSTVLVVRIDDAQILCSTLPFGHVLRAAEKLPVMSIDEASANAILIADAFNVANETNFTPSQLAAHRDLLADALLNLRNGYEKLYPTMGGPLSALAARARDALAATGYKP